MRVNSRRSLMSVLTLMAGIGGLSNNAGAEGVERLPYEGASVSVLGQFVKADGGNALGNGGGVVVAGGLRRGSMGFEARGSYASQKPGTLIGGSLNGLLFPFQSLAGFYGIAGIGLVNIDDYPGTGKASFNITTASGGAGYIFPLQVQHHKFGLRVEALYQYGKRNKRSQDQSPPAIDLPVESSFKDLIFQVGLQFSFGKPKGREQGSVTPAQVVPVDESFVWTPAAIGESPASDSVKPGDK